jgi:hypothetical protein
LKAVFNWSISHQLTVANPVRHVKLFHEDNSRLRYLIGDGPLAQQRVHAFR